MFGKYQILELVGQGGLGEVYRAFNTKTNEVVALKRLHDRFQRNPTLMGLFHKETMIHARVSHRHCVRFIEANLTPPNAHIVTEFIEGTNVNNLINTTGVVPPIVACTIMLDMLQGLEHLHCLDIIHSDLSPSNVMVDKTGRVVVADFGLSCDMEVEDYSGVNVGTPGYVAPERLNNEPMTTLSDVYCAGIILFEMLCGQRMYFGQPREVIIKRMKNIDVSWLNTGNPKLNFGIGETLKRALALKPSKRFESPRDFMYALYQCISLYNIRYPRKAILQWLRDRRLSDFPLDTPQQIYVR